MDYTVIAETGKALVELLREGLVPQVLHYEEQIGLCAPQEKGDYSVKVWLYDIKSSALMQSHRMVDIGREQQKYPSAYVDLSYMITAFSAGDVRYQASEEAHILGKIIQTLRDTSVIDWSGKKGAAGIEPQSRIEMVNLSMDDKLKIYHVPDGSYKTSLFYEVGPVEIESMRQRRVKRVKNLDFTLQEKE